MLQQISIWGTLAATIATAISTFFLWRVTKVLAVETKRMADASAQPQIVASIVPNQWAINHTDFVVENTGNASAFDIDIVFDPPLPRDGENSSGRFVPFQSISLIKPGQVMSSHLTETENVMNIVYRVTIRWKRNPESDEQECLSYTLNMADYEGMARLGAASPAIQIAEQVKKIREDWQRIATGQRKLKADIYTEADRRGDRESIEKRFQQAKRHVAERGEQPGSD